MGNRKHLWDSCFNIPEIRDSNGVFVRPNQWESKLAHSTPVTVDFVLKLYESTPYIVLTQHRLTLRLSRWEIPFNRITQREGSRIYQLVLRKIQIHPCNKLSHSIIKPSFLKGKRRAEDDTEEDNGEGGGPSTPTKVAKRAKKGSRNTADGAGLGENGEDVVMGNAT